MMFRFHISLILLLLLLIFNAWWTANSLLVKHYHYVETKTQNNIAGMKMLSKISAKENDWIQKNCGQTLNGESIFKVIGGNESEIDQFPWAVSIRYRTNGGQYRHQCTGSIISRRHVLSAAHCFLESSKPNYYACQKIFLDPYWQSFEVFYGGPIMKCAQDGNHDCKGIKSVPISKVHLPLNPAKRLCALPAYDYVILEVANNIKFDSGTLPICLLFDWKRKFLTDSLFNAGWGIDESGEISQVLRYKHAKVLSIVNEPYMDEDGKQSKRKNFTGSILTRGYKCCGIETGVVMPTICPGDSGGPLFGQAMLRDGKERTMLLGIHSAGPAPGACERKQRLGLTPPEGISYFDWESNTFVPGIVDEICHWTGVCPNE